MTENSLLDAVARALAPVAEQETEWDNNKLEKRVREYFRKAAKTLEFSTKSWDVLVNDYCDSVFASLFQALGNRDWLAQVDFLLVVDAGIKEFFPAHLITAVPGQTFMTTVLKAHDRAFEEQRYLPILWVVVQGHVDENSVRKKTYRAGEYGRRVASAATRPGKVPNPNEVQDYVARWVDATIKRLSRDMQGYPETALPEVRACELFRELIRAGTLPVFLVAEHGVPSPAWPFVEQAVRMAYAAHVDDKGTASIAGVRSKALPRQNANGVAGRGVSDCKAEAKKRPRPPSHPPPFESLIHGGVAVAEACGVVETSNSSTEPYQCKQDEATCANESHKMWEPANSIASAGHCKEDKDENNDEYHAGCVDASSKDLEAGSVQAGHLHAEEGICADASSTIYENSSSAVQARHCDGDTAAFTDTPSMMQEGIIKEFLDAEGKHRVEFPSGGCSEVKPDDIKVASRPTKVVAGSVSGAAAPCGTSGLPAADGALAPADALAGTAAPVVASRVGDVPCEEGWSEWLQQLRVASFAGRGGSPRGAGIIAFRRPRLEEYDAAPTERYVCLVEKARKWACSGCSALMYDTWMVCTTCKQARPSTAVRFTPGCRMRGPLGFPKGGRESIDRGCVYQSAMREWFQETGIARERLEIVQREHVDDVGLGVRLLVAHCTPSQGGPGSPDLQCDGETSWVSPEAKVQCPAGHLLNAEQVAQAYQFCGRCSKMVSAGSVVLSCAACSHHVCTDCQDPDPIFMVHWLSVGHARQQLKQDRAKLLDEALLVML